MGGRSIVGESIRGRKIIGCLFKQTFAFLPGLLFHREINEEFVILRLKVFIYNDGRY